MTTYKKLESLIDDCGATVAGKGVNLSGVKRADLPTAIAKLPNLSKGYEVDLVKGGTYIANDGRVIEITPIDGETRAIRFLVGDVAYRAFMMYFVMIPGETGTVDWGDGSPLQTFAHNEIVLHIYEKGHGIPTAAGDTVYFAQFYGNIRQCNIPPDPATVGGRVYNSFLAVAIKSDLINGCSYLTRGNGGRITCRIVEHIYLDLVACNEFSYLSEYNTNLKTITIKNRTPATFGGAFVNVYFLRELDLSEVRVSGDFFGAAGGFFYMRKLLFNPENFEIGNINIMSTALDHEAVTALFNSLPSVGVTKNLTLKLDNAPELTEEEIAVATNKNWNIIRS